MPKKFAKKYVVEDRTGGSLRFYFRRKGQPKVRLPGLPGTDEFNAAYYAALEGVQKEKTAGPKMAGKGTFRWLCQLYFQSAEYKQLDSKTRYRRKLIVEAMWKEPIKKGDKKLFEDVPIPAFTAKAVRVLRDRKAETPDAANSWLKALRAIFAWATMPAVELCAVNPARDIPYFKTGSEGYHSWTEDEVDQFIAKHPIGTKAYLALMLMLYTSQRRSDIVLFGKQHMTKGWLRFVQEKDKKRKPRRLEMPLHPNLVKAIEAGPCGDLTLLVTEFDKPFTSNGFGNWFRKRCDEADLTHCSAHGLRKAAAARLADRGATEHQIMAITGHTTSKEVIRYTKAARQKVLAKSAIKLMDQAVDDSDD
ncbi:site-specific integrase [Agrobacterium pusense]|uniref:site-specific integrase n=1 Tax=Agrobacterium pusense TaxID=648995 RepID=UPI002414E176|nr:tyrosine-type recombinase/integrase [Agrobacterium pusense]WFN88003.1 tyrosine-type recombinase/integrase [Agrobacterium pusense]